MKTLLESVQIYKPARHDSLLSPEIKLVARRKIQISLHDGSPDDVRWVIGTLLTVLGEFAPANNLSSSPQPSPDPATAGPPSPAPASEGIQPTANN